MMHPYLSVVAASRNDDHGGDPLHRTQIFINCFARQCEKYRLPAELILVDWNPVPNRPGLAAVLQLPAGLAYCAARVITVPAVLHRTVKYGDRLAFFQMIAKNAGIRRAKGTFVLATNIDIIFSDELMAYLGEQDLDPGRLYRVDRYDIKTELPIDADVDFVLDKAWRSVIRTNRRANLPEVLDPIYDFDQACRDCRPHVRKFKGSDKIHLVEGREHWHLRPHPNSPIEHLNTNACGDFTLLSRRAWDEIRGYPEFEAFSFNIDSMGLVAAHYHGYRELSLLPPCVCFHIEHGLGSGYTPEGEQTLFDRLRAKRILSPDWPVLNRWVETMREQQRAIDFNRENWGLADFTLPERPMGSALPLGSDDFIADTGRACSLLPEYDLDSATLFHERESRLSAGSRIQQAVAPAVAVPAPVPAVEAVVVGGGADEGHSILDRCLTSNRPVVVWSAQEDFERVRSLLSSRGEREVIAAGASAGNGSAGAHPGGCDGVLLATDPRQMVLDLHRHGLLAGKKENAELVIWVDGDDPSRMQDVQWTSAVRLARRLLGEVGWRVTVSQAGLP